LAFLLYECSTNQFISCVYFCFVEFAFHLSQQTKIWSVCARFKQLYFHTHWKLGTRLFELIYSQQSILPAPQIFTFPPETPCILPLLLILHIKFVIYELYSCIQPGVFISLPLFETVIILVSPRNLERDEANFSDTLHTESDVWTQHLKFISFYCTVYCTYCNFLYLSHNLLQYRF
jgi:hypothetical protein